MVMGTNAQILVERIWINHLARVHLPIGVPDRLELTKGLNQLLTEHLGQEFSPRLPIAMFARKRSSIAQDQISCLLYKGTVILRPLSGFEDKINTGMHA